MKGEAVTVVFYRDGVADAFGSPVRSELARQLVSPVLVAPGPRQDVTASNRPDGVEVAFTLHFPKAFTASLRGCDVKVRGELFRVIGDPRTFTISDTPTLWNRVVEVSRVDG